MRTTLPLKGTDYTIEEIAAIFGHFISAVLTAEGAQHVDVVVHSEGGMVARAWMAGLAAQPYAGEIARLATIGTPHYGIPLHITGSKVDQAELRTITGLFGNTSCSDQQASEMAYGSEFVSQLHDSWQTFQTGPFALDNDKQLFIAGTHGTPGSLSGECNGIPDSQIPGTPCNDGLVDVDSAVLPTASLSDNVRYVPYKHCPKCGLGTEEARITDAAHKTYLTIDQWLLTGTPAAQCCGASTIDYTPSFFTDPSKEEGFLLLRFRDAADKHKAPASLKSITFDPQLTTQPYAFTNAGSVTITKIPPGLYTISLEFPGYEVHTVQVAIRFNRPTVPDVLLLKHK